MGRGWGSQFRRRDRHFGILYTSLFSDVGFLKSKSIKVFKYILSCYDFSDLLSSFAVEGRQMGTTPSLKVTGSARVIIAKS